jgi:hypothetical protein
MVGIISSIYHSFVLGILLAFSKIIVLPTYHGRCNMSKYKLEMDLGRSWFEVLVVFALQSIKMPWRGWS